MSNKLKFSILTAFSLLCLPLAAQRYTGVVDKSIAVVGNEMIKLSDLESQVQMLNAQGYSSDKNIRCDVLESMMESKLFLMQARVDSLNVNHDMVSAALNQRLDQIRTALGGDAEVEEYFGMPLYKLRQEWQSQLEEQSLTQSEQQEIASKIPEITPYDVKQYLDTADVDALPVVPIKYQLSQICIYPDREAAAMAVKERLLSLRERILNGESFATLARLYSEDTGSAMKGGELGMASKSIFWPHIIEVLEKNGDMFNARHILIRPHYTEEDQEKAFKVLDSLRTAIVVDSTISFDLAARFYSQDPATRTNGGQMSDPNTGSSYFEIDQLKPQDYAAVKDLEIGEVSEPVASLDNEGRNGNLVYKILRLDRIVPAHTANFETDYTELLDIVVQQRQNEAIDKFIDDKLDSTYIVIDPLFGDCDFSRDGWAQKVRQEE